MKTIMCALLLCGVPATCLAQGSTKSTTTATTTATTSSTATSDTSTAVDSKKDDHDDKGKSDTVLSLPVVAPAWLMLLILGIVILQVVLLFRNAALRRDVKQALENSVTQLQASISQINAGITPILTLVANRTSSTAQYPFAPQITGLSPDRGKLAGNTRVEITGRNFSPDVQVWFGSTRVSLQPGPTTTQLVINTPPGVPGDVDVYLVGASGVISQRAVTYRYVDFRLDGVDHAAGMLRLTGAGFTASTQVWIDNQQIQAVQFDHEGRIEVALPPPQAHHVFAVVAVNPGGDRSETRTYPHG